MSCRVRSLFLLTIVWALCAACEIHGHPPGIGGEVEQTIDDSDDPNRERFAFSPNLQNQDCPASYNLVHIPKIGGPFSQATGINDRGWVFGTTHTHADPALNRSEGFIWKPDQVSMSSWRGTGEVTGEVETFEVEGLPDGSDFDPTWILDINQSGQMVGYADYVHPSGFDGVETVPFYWSESEGLHYLDVREVYGINNDGIVVGVDKLEEDEDSFEAGFIWTLADGFTYLPRLPGAWGNAGSRALAINSAGVVAATARTAQDDVLALKYTLDTEYSRLPNYPRVFANVDILASPNGINDWGQIVGGSGTKPVLWEANGEMHDLGILPEPRALISGEAVGINDDGIIVGADSQPHDVSYGWSWCGGQKRSFADTVNDADGWRFTFATGINDDGWISVNTLDPSGSPEMAVLIPVWHLGPPIE